MGRTKNQRLTVHLQVDEPFATLVDQGDLEAAAVETLESENVVEGEMTVVVTDDETVRGLNRQYRGVDAPTDVLSFQTGGDDQGFVSSPESAGYLGDVVIAYPFTAVQAKEAGRSVQHDLILMVIHGTLHLLGYDHATSEEEREMWKKQDAILRRLTGDQPSDTPE